MSDQPKCGGVYRHFKGNLYCVLFIATHTETEELMVIYQSIDHPEKVWARPLELWNRPAMPDGKKVERFTYLSDFVNYDKLLANSADV